MSEQRKKPQRKKSKKITINPRKSWQDIVNDVEKQQVPIRVLQCISVELIDGTNIIINIKDLIEDGQNLDEIEALLDEKFNQLDQYIKNVDFYVDIDKVVSTIQPETDKILKNL